ncbi:unnamed protein product [Schistocephalus solidus]|uniref:Uncharacterized protein n=1 Tax=Schistocephalus solidus TaxID=70667 RepID=A0A183S8R4_SCHSO|nr:unnamed protein product [Schistocephalus solidus]
MWCASQDCFDLTKSPLETFIPMDDELLISNSLPTLLRTALKSQIELTAPPTCVSRYSLHDLLYACCISNGVNSLTKRTSLGDQCRTNTLSNKLDSACTSELQPKVDSLKVLENAQLPSPQILRDVYLNGTVESIAKNILLIEHRLLDPRALNDEWRQILAETIMSSPSVILRAAVNLSANNTDHVDASRLYSQIFCGLLKIWSFVFDKRLILKNTPQSYLYLCGFVGPRFQNMELNDLSKVIILETQLLTNYLHIFRSAVLSSPHWYLQMLIDVVNAIFDRFQTGLYILCCPPLFCLNF